MNICGPMGHMRVAAGMRMRLRGPSMLRAVRTLCRIRTIRQCRNQKRGRFMTAARVRVARRRVVLGRRGRLAISPGDVFSWPEAAALPGLMCCLALRGCMLAAPRRAFARVEVRSGRAVLSARPFVSPAHRRSRSECRGSRHTSRSADSHRDESGRCTAPLSHLTSS